MFYSLSLASPLAWKIRLVSNSLYGLLLHLLECYSSKSFLNVDWFIGNKSRKEDNGSFHFANMVQSLDLWFLHTANWYPLRYDEKWVPLEKMSKAAMSFYSRDGNHFIAMSMWPWIITSTVNLHTKLKSSNISKTIWTWLAQSPHCRHFDSSNTDVSNNIGHG